jgi:dihydrofolate reductase
VILQEFVTIDGLAAGAKDSVDFVPASTAGDRSFGDRQMDFLDSIDAMLLGRVTYEMFAGYWPNVTSGEDKPFADKLNALAKFVFSSTLDRAPWGSWGDATIVRDGAATEVQKLKQKSSGKSIVIWGSLSLARSLMREGLIDEYQLIVCPVVLGSGRTLFGEEVGAFNLDLMSTRAFDRGTALLAYEQRNTPSNGA